MSEHTATIQQLRDEMAALARGLPTTITPGEAASFVAALDALAATAARAEQERDEARALAQQNLEIAHEHLDDAQTLAMARVEAGRDHDDLAARLAQAHETLRELLTLAEDEGLDGSVGDAQFPVIVRARAVLAGEGDTPPTKKPRGDWYCRCREPAPDRIGTIPVLRPASRYRCAVCFTDAPWVAGEGDSE